MALQDSCGPSTVALSLVLAVPALLVLSLPGATSCCQSFPNFCWDEPGMSQDSPWPWILMSGCSWGALGTSSMASCVPHLCVHPILAMLSPQGDAHTPGLHSARVWDTGARPGDSGNTPGCAWRSPAERDDLGTSLGDNQWHQPPCSGFVSLVGGAIQAVAVPVSATVVAVPVTVSGLGACAPPSSRPRSLIIYWLN